MSTEAVTNESQLTGFGFVFFRWHISQYDGPAWKGHPHPEYEQTECRRLFRKLAPLPALDVSKQP